MRKSDVIQYWAEHKCVKCGKHSVNQETVKLVKIGNGYFCEDCINKIWGKE